MRARRASSPATHVVDDARVAVPEWWLNTTLAPPLLRTRGELTSFAHRAV
jgi:hypothetical protein